MDFDSTSPSMQQNGRPRQPFLVLVVIISFIVGGVAGFLGSIISAGGLSNLLNRNGTSIFSSSSTPTSLSVQEESATVDVVKKASPAVVSIIASADYSSVYGNNSPSQYFNPFFSFPYLQTPQRQGPQQVAAGSGFIVSGDGIILTNKHVATVANASQFKVITNDGKTYDATVIATDPSTDIAFMKIDAKDLPTIPLGDSGKVQIGQTVVAIGNALGEYRNTVTKGIISGLARTVRAGDSASGTAETLHNVIQTDAAINEGNSGGPLLDLAGQAIGINTAIDQSGQLVGFSIPISVAKSDLESVLKGEKIQRPYLGVRYQIVNATVQSQEKLSVDYGALIVAGNGQNEPAIISGSPADKAGLKAGDIILEVNGTKVDEDHDLAQLLQDLKVGNAVTLKVLSSGNTKDVQAILAANPS